MACPCCEFVAAIAEGHARIRKRLRGANADTRFSVTNCQAEGGILVGLPYGTNLANGIPILTESFGLTGSEEGEVGLIIGEDASHEFDVRAVLVGEVPVPGVTKFVVAPRPLLLSRGDVMISDVDEASSTFVVVAAAKIFHRSDSHVAGGHRDVGVPSQVVCGIVPGRHELAGPLFFRNS